MLLVPEDTRLTLDPGEVRTRLLQAGLITDAGEPVCGLGLPVCASLRVDAPTGPVLYGNQQGGIEVRCPDTHEPVATALSEALTRMRAGEDGTVRCACGGSHPPNGLWFAPPAAVASSALVVVDVESYSLEEPARGLLAEVLGPFSILPRRVS